MYLSFWMLGCLFEQDFDTIYAEILKTRIGEFDFMDTITFGKTVVLGDSYSTFDGAIPLMYPPYYSKNGRNGLTSMGETWWGILLSEGRGELLLNSSYSGSAIAEITYYARHERETSFPTRYQKDLDGLDFDTVLIFGGTNDTWAGSPLGTVKTEAPYTKEDLLCTVSSFGYLLSLIRKAHPHARIVNLINDELDPRMVDGMEITCKHFGADNICLRGISKNAGHPDLEGMRQIATQIRAFYQM